MGFATESGEMRATRGAAQSAAAAPAWLDVIDQTPTCSSTSLGWRHLEAHRFDGLRCWNLNLPPCPQHFIAAHLLKPCRIDAQWGGRTHRARSQPGHAMLMAAGQDSVWHCSDAIDELHVFLDPSILDEVAQEIGEGQARLASLRSQYQPVVR